MKKTFILLMALAGIAGAGESQITLLYGMDFNKLSGGIVYENIAASPGAGTVNSQGYGYHNYVTGMDGSYASDIRSSGAYYFDITGTDGLGVNTGNGFTLTFNTSFVSNDDWTSLLGFNIGGQDLVFHWGGITTTGTTKTTSMNIYTKDDGGAVSTDSVGLRVAGMEATKWYNVALVAKNGDLTLSVFTPSSELVGSTTVKSKYTGSLNSVTGYVNYKFNTSYIDNLAIYDGALTNEQLAALTRYEMKNQTLMQSVPEPTTATLSLLALAGLAARRRRRMA